MPNASDPNRPPARKLQALAVGTVLVILLVSAILFIVARLRFLFS
nr:hypothetical protein [uncultured Holophaga sp.]